VDKLVASPELDKRIAEEVMGMEQCPAWTKGDPDCRGRETWWVDVAQCPHREGKKVCDPEMCYPPESPPRYSIDMGRAGQLLGKLFEWAEHEGVPIGLFANDGKYQCIASDARSDDDEPAFGYVQRFYDTPQLAICDAALHYLGRGKQ